MAWIRMLADDDADEELRGALRAGADPRTGRTDEIMRVHSLKAESLTAHLALYRSAMRPSAGLGLREREMIALVVSAINGCHY